MTNQLENSLLLQETVFGDLYTVATPIKCAMFSSAEIQFGASA